MSNLKHLSLQQLKQAKKDCVKYQRYLENRIRKDKQTLSGQRERARWIDRYIDNKQAENQQSDFITKRFMEVQ